MDKEYNDAQNKEAVSNPCMNCIHWGICKHQFEVEKVINELNEKYRPDNSDLDTILFGIKLSCKRFAPLGGFRNGK